MAEKSTRSYPYFQLPFLIKIFREGLYAKLQLRHEIILRDA